MVDHSLVSILAVNVVMVYDRAHVNKLSSARKSKNMYPVKVVFQLLDTTSEYESHKLQFMMWLFTSFPGNLSPCTKLERTIIILPHSLKLDEYCT